uniref:Uncharacterized protein n=1 Tax=Spumella elongata TaxID=89044 RepID=A0A7S3H1K2_9STRA|mmetsp:Transcript_304/g.521  ORF Transcript_304/g.521 Transcript_304/m.521 type:complete len:184 (+) Transcript_304:50-601(+)
MPETPCERFAAANGNTDMTTAIAAIGTDINDEYDNLLQELRDYHGINEVYPEYLAWWLLFVANDKWSEAENIKWINELISRKIPVIVAHNQAVNWRNGTGTKKSTWGTWQEAKMLLDAGYKWNAVDVLPVALLPPADILLAVAKGDEEELTDKLTNLKVSGEDADDAEKVSGNDVDEDGGDKK